ncbi:MAG: hypothetical protein KA457_10945, partial [Chitinophagales bacterium]|nr:hypothetical protein [Chitinophagales bacterium]
MKTFIGFIVFLVCGFNLFASDPTWKWARQVGGNGYDQAICVAATPENVYWSGVFSDSAAFGNSILVPKSDDAFLCNNTPTGVFNWVLQCGGIGSQIINKIDIIDFNKTIIVGSFSESLNVGDYNFISNGKQDGFISKI